MCAGCGHASAYAHKQRLIDECTSCGKQHSLLAGTIFEQTKTGLARWFLAIFLVTSSKRGLSAAELKRQMGFGSDQTAWSWLHKIRRAMVRPEREPLAAPAQVDETYLGAPKPGKRGRGAAGKVLVAGAVECRSVTVTDNRTGEPKAVRLDLPRFRGEVRAWHQGIWSDGILSSFLSASFGSAAIIFPSRPAHTALAAERSGGQGRPAGCRRGLARRFQAVS